MLFPPLQFPHLFFKNIPKFLSLHTCPTLYTLKIFLSQLLSVSTRQSKPHISHYNTLYSITPSTFSSHFGTKRNIPTSSSFIFCACYLAFSSVFLIFHAALPTNQTCYSQFVQLTPCVLPTLPFEVFCLSSTAPF
jgi:hypothetical protein